MQSIPPIIPTHSASKRRLKALLYAAAAAVALCLWYWRTHPLVFNESFTGHAHCIVGGGQSLLAYAREHDGRFPYHTNGYGDALVMVNAGWDSSLTGPGYDAQVFDRARKSGEDAPESEFGRVYVQGLTEENDTEIALLFDKLPTPGGYHCTGFARLKAPLAREAWTVGSGHLVIPESKWPAYAKRQIELLITAGITREQAERYYSEKPKR